MKGFSSKLIALKVDASQDREIDCLQAGPCTFQLGNFTGWDSEAVKQGDDELTYIVLRNGSFDLHFMSDLIAH